MLLGHTSRPDNAVIADSDGGAEKAAWPEGSLSQPLLDPVAGGVSHYMVDDHSSQSVTPAVTESSPAERAPGDRSNSIDAGKTSPSQQQRPPRKFATSVLWPIGGWLVGTCLSLLALPLLAIPRRPRSFRAALLLGVPSAPLAGSLAYSVARGAAASVVGIIVLVLLFTGMWVLAATLADFNAEEE